MTESRPLAGEREEGRENVEQDGRMTMRRRGISLIEIIAAGVLLAVMLTICLQLFRAMAAQRQALQARQTAVREVANVMERLCARPWEELTPEAAGQVQLSAEAQQVLPGGALEIDVVRPEDEPDGKRVTIVLRWPAGLEQPDRSVRLVAWRYRATGP